MNGKQNQHGALIVVIMILCSITNMGSTFCLLIIEALPEVSNLIKSVYLNCYCICFTTR